MIQIHISKETECALVWRTGLSGVPPDSVRCTKTVQLQTRHPQVSLSALRYNSPDCLVCHRIVRCTSGATTLRRNGRLQRTPANATVHGQCAQKLEQSLEAHRTVNNDCPVPLEDKASNGQKLANPNGWVTWLAHRTVRCAHRQQPLPTAMWWLRAINTPNHHHSKHPSFQHF
jgi:uncharacterized protein (DUF2237 family)